MGVLVTGAWPMSQPIPSGSGGSNSSGNSSNCVVLRNTPTTTYQHDNYSSPSAASPHRQIMERPLSMPGSCSLLGGELSPVMSSTCYCDPMLHQDPSCHCMSTPTLKPSYRRSSQMTSQENHSRPPTCVSWLKKANVIKKIQRKMRIGNGGGISPNNLPPLLFNMVHGDNIRLSNDRTVAKRMNSFCKGIAFSDRPVKVKEKLIQVRKCVVLLLERKRRCECLSIATVCSKMQCSGHGHGHGYNKLIVEVANNWKGAVRFGFTNKDPNLFRGGLPKNACPDLSEKKGFWAKGLNDVYVKQGAILSYYVNKAGDIQFGINGKEQGLFLSGVDTRRPLWALLDVYGNTISIELVDPRAQLNNSKKNVSSSDCSAYSGEDMEMTLMSSMSAMNLRSCSERSSQRYYSAAQLRSIHESLALRNIKGSATCRVSSSNYEYESIASIFPTSESAMFRHSKSQTHLASKSQATGQRSLAEAGRSNASKSTTNMSSLYQTPPAPRHNQKSQQQLQQQQYQPKPLPPLPLPPKSMTYSCLPNSAREAVVRSTNNYSTPLHAKMSVSPVSSGKNSQSSSSKPVTSAIAQQEAYKRKSLIFTPNNNVQGTSSPIYSTHVKDIGGEISNYSVECVACCERPVDSVFYACGHMCMCFQCATEYWKTKEKGACPICRASISDVIRTYKS